MTFFERIADELFWFFVLFILFVLAIVIWTVDLFFSQAVDRWMTEFFRPDQKDPIGAYGRFREDHPVLCWLFQFPLILVGM